MLEATMRPNGLQLVNDAKETDEERLERLLKSRDPEGRWVHEGPNLMRRSKIAGDGERILKEVAASFDHDDGHGERQRFLWGPGFIVARKVRLLHSSMRIMLTHPQNFSPTGSDDEPATLAEGMSRLQEPWNTTEFGVPVNQEDLAYTLLTFGYLLPKGLSQWGCPVSVEERDGFLHMWKTIGHIMGIKEELLTDDWAAAEDLFNTVLTRQGEPSSKGQEMTKVLLGFLGEYLPGRFNLADRIGATLIIDQLGEERGRMLLEASLFERATTPVWGILIATLKLALRGYYIIRERIIGNFPTIRALFGNLLDQSARALLESWRGSYVRKPFYVPVDAHTWRREPGADDAHLAALQKWRSRFLFDLLATVLMLMLAAFCLVGSVAFYLFDVSGFTVAAGATVLFAAGALAYMKWRLPRIFAARPPVPSVPGVRDNHVQEDTKNSISGANPGASKLQ